MDRLAVLTPTGYLILEDDEVLASKLNEDQARSYLNNKDIPAHIIKKAASLSITSTHYEILREAEGKLEIVGGKYETPELTTFSINHNHLSGEHYYTLHVRKSTIVTFV